MKKISHGGNIYKKAKEMGIREEDILDFSANISPLGLPEHIRQAMIEAIAGTINYPDPDCSRLKEAISIQDNVPESHIACGNGGADLLYRLAFGLQPKKVLLPAPAFVEYEEALSAAGAQMEYYLMRNDFVIRENILEQITEETDFVVICNPNNPTGMNFDLTSVVEVAKSVGAYLFVDEVYRGLNHSGYPYSKSAVDLYEKAIVTGSMSKTYSLAGIRLGWIVANPNIIEQINSNREYNTISISALDDYVATIALENHEKIVERNLKIILENKKIILNFINSNSHFSWVEPNAGTIACINFDYDLTSEDFCASLFDKTGVLTIPASCFDMNQNFFRIGYAMDSQMLQEALNLISDWVRKTY